MKLDKFPPWSVVKRLKGEIDIYNCKCGAGEQVRAREWPRKPNVKQGSSFQLTHLGGDLTIKSYRTMSEKWQGVCKIINGNLNDTYLDHFRHGVQSYAIRMQIIPPIVTDIDMSWIDPPGAYLLQLISTHNGDNYLIRKRPPLTQYTQPATGIIRGVKCPVTYYIRKKYTYYDFKFKLDPTGSPIYTIKPETDIAILVEEPNIQEPKPAYFGPVRIEKLFEIYQKFYV